MRASNASNLRHEKFRAFKSENAPDNILRKEVIQPQVPLRLPCYDLVPVADPTVVRCLLKG